jgi:glycosyltransferase involved in cell wall biosynthesis
LRGDHPPAIAVVHNPADHDARFRQRLAARMVLGRCRGLFTHAKILADGLKETYPSLPVASYPLPPPELLPLPAKHDARADLGLPNTSRVALFLGLIRPYKGVDLLLEAMARLAKDSDWFLVVAGEPWGKLGSSLEAQVRTLGLENRVRLDLGWVPEMETTRLLAAADLVVLPYRSGSQSAVAPVALGCGVPVLSTSVGGLSEVIRHQVDGFLVEPGSVKALTDALEDLGRSRLEQLALGAHDFRDRLSWDGYAAALEKLVEHVIEAG